MTPTDPTTLLLAHFDAITATPDGLARLRQLILQLAVQGRLVKQDPNDEPVSVLLERLREERTAAAQLAAGLCAALVVGEAYERS